MTDRSPLPPCIVLVRPQLGENIGAVARAMLNFRLTDLRLVDPRDGWPNPAAGPTAAGADAVLDGARVFGTLADAVADCVRVYATTVRGRGMTKLVATPDHAASEAHRLAASGGRTALVFGPERAGLETDDVALADAILTIPVNPDFGSINLAQAVIVIVYEWHRQLTAGLPRQVLHGGSDLPASHAALEGLIGQLEDALEPRGYFFPAHRTRTLKRVLRNLFSRPGFNEQEVRTLRGIISTLTSPRDR